jgi:hypothetical protein
MFAERVTCCRPTRAGCVAQLEIPLMPQITEAFLDAFADSWNRHDIDAIMAAMTDDCVFQPAVGAEVHGARFVGQEDVRRGIERFFDAYPDSRWKNPTHFIVGDRGVTEWIFSATGPSGMIETNGCDVFTFRDGKIAVKDSYRKQRAG